MLPEALLACYGRIIARNFIEVLKQYIMHSSNQFGITWKTMQGV